MVSSLPSNTIPGHSLAFQRTMVGFVERFRKPKLSAAVSPSREDTLITPQTPDTPQRHTPPVLRNFSYPINVGRSEQPPSYPSPEAGQTPWDQLGEICNFSPGTISRVGRFRTSGLDDPFFFRSEGEEDYIQLDDEGENSQREEFGIGISPDLPSDRESLSLEEPKARKKQRRGTLLRLSSSQAQGSSRL